MAWTEETQREVEANLQVAQTVRSTHLSLTVGLVAAALEEIKRLNGVIDDTRHERDMAEAELERCREAVRDCARIADDAIKASTTRAEQDVAATIRNLILARHVYGLASEKREEE